MKTVTISARVPASLKQALQRAADADHRTLTSYLIAVLEQHAKTGRLK